VRSLPFQIEYCAVTHANQGLGSRARNEDAILVAGGILQGEIEVCGVLSGDKTHLLAISDGVHSAPRPASASHLLLKDLDKIFRESQYAHPATKLNRLQERYNLRACRQPQFTGMTATLVATEVRGCSALIYHVGDSPAWLIRGGKAKRLTRDHTILERMIDEGEVERGQADDLATIYQGLDRYFAALPSEDKPAHDLCSVTLDDGDVLLLASDGLSVLTAEQLGAQQFDDLQTAASSLFQSAVACGSEDNITLLVVRPLSRSGSA